MREFSDLNYNHYVNLFKATNDELSLQELYLLREKCPEFDFSKYKVGIFTLPNIEKFGQDFLLNNYEWLTQSILELEKDKVEYLFTHRKFITFDSEAISSLSNIDLDKLNEVDDPDEFALFSELSRSYDFKNILDRLLEKRDVISFVSKYFENVYSTYLRNCVRKFVLDDYSKICIDVIDKNYITTSSDLHNFLKSYFLCKGAIKFINNKNKVMFSDLLFNNHILNLNINSEEELNNYFDLKYKKVINLLDNNVRHNKEIISELYFNIEYDVLKKALNTAKKCKLFEKYTRFLDLSTTEELIGFIDLIKCETNIYYEIEKALTLVSKKSICDSIRPQYSPNNGIVVLDGKDFSFLVHSIKGYANMNQAGLLADNPALWYSSPREDSYISTSYISHDFMGMNNSISYILGFNNITEEDILYAGLGDIYSSTKQVRNNLRNGKSSCVLADDLRLNPQMLYNEVTLKRVRNGTILRPDFILSLDKISKSDVRASKYFKVPIYLLERIKYAGRMNEKLNRDLDNDDLDSYLADLRRMFFSFCNSDEVFLKYFSADKLEFNTLRLIRKYMDSDDVEILSKIEEIICLYDNLIMSYNFYKDSAIEYDKKRYVNMLKKR